MYSSEISSEINLVVATVEQAVRDIVRGSARDRACAQRWVRSSAEGPFSFLWCCNILDIDAESARNAIENQIDEVRMRMSRIRGQVRAINTEG